MKSLFTKILVWFLATTLFTTVALLLVAALTFTGPHEKQMPFSLLTAAQLREAKSAYESGGAEALRARLERMFEDTGMRGILTDRNGRDLVTGEDRSRLIAESRRRGVWPVRVGDWYVIDRQDADGDYWIFLLLPRHRWMNWFIRPRFLMIIGVALLLCYLLARHLTLPVRQLKRAVERFGQGDLNARVGSRRSDELGDLGRTFDRMADRIQTLLAAERRLLLDISHELRSPLARLNVAAELAGKEENREAALAQIRKESDRMNALVGELLAVTRAEGDAAALRRSPVRLEALIGDLVADSTVEARARGCSIELERADAIALTADPELLRRAIENVLRNAIRHSPEGGRIGVTLGRDGSAAVVTIRDHGPGVPEDALPHLFEPFYRVETDRGRASGGAGLGLAIAKRAVNVHGGGIRARNAAPGLEVEISLPVGQA